jgi:flagellar biosynthetic protein FlhB
MSGVPDRDQRVHPPTPRRVEEFRKRGEIALSRDLTSALALGAGAVALALGAPGAAAQITNFTVGALRSLEHGSAVAPRAIVSLAGEVIVACAAPVAVAATVAVGVAGLLQLGWPPALRGLKMEIGRVLGFSSLGQIVSLRQLGFRTLLALAKLGAVGAVAAAVVAAEWRRFLAAPVLSATALGARLAGAIGRVAAAAIGALVVLGALEYLKARRDLAARMRMTTEELRREAREMDGDPHVKRRRRQRMRELAKRRLTAAVASADTVIVNPTHYAVAIRYRAEEAQAPRVVAKGVDAEAARIRELARQHGVPVVSEPPLCRLIYKLVPEGRQIPAELYKAVAEVLAYVYRLRNRRAGTSRRTP